MMCPVVHFFLFCLCFIRLPGSQNVCLQSIWEIIHHYHFNYCLSPFLIFSTSVTPIKYMLDFSLLSSMSLSHFFFSITYALCATFCVILFNLSSIIPGFHFGFFYSAVWPIYSIWQSLFLYVGYAYSCS